MRSNAAPQARALVSTLTLAALLALALPAIAADNAKQLYNKGRDAEARQDYEQAYEYFRQAFQKAPKEIKYRVAFERTRFLSSASHVRGCCRPVRRARGEGGRRRWGTA